MLRRIDGGAADSCDRRRWSLTECSRVVLSALGRGGLGTTYKQTPPVQLLFVAMIFFFFFSRRRYVFIFSPLEGMSSLAHQTWQPGSKKILLLFFMRGFFLCTKEETATFKVCLCCSRGLQGGPVSYPQCHLPPVSVAKLDGRVKKKKNTITVFSFPVSHSFATARLLAVKVLAVSVCQRLERRTEPLPSHLGAFKVTLLKHRVCTTTP